MGEIVVAGDKKKFELIVGDKVYRDPKAVNRRLKVYKLRVRGKTLDWISKKLGISITAVHKLASQGADIYKEYLEDNAEMERLMIKSSLKELSSKFLDKALEGEDTNTKAGELALRALKTMIDLSGMEPARKSMVLTASTELSELQKMLGD